MRIKENLVIAHKETILSILKDWDKLDNAKKIGVRAALAEYANKHFLHYETICSTCTTAQTYADKVYEFLKNPIKKSKERNDTNGQ